MYRQRTVREAVSCVGIGLHSGKKVSLKVRPAPVDTGIVFLRTDLPGSPPIKASVENVVDTSYATTIGTGNVTVSTIEHLMASFSGLGIDNAFVEVNAPEVPIMDGSAAPFLYLLKCGGIKAQSSFKKFLVVKKRIRVDDNDSFAEISPSKELKITCSLEFNHPLVKKQDFDLAFSDSAFEKEVSRARTFGFLQDVEKMRANGLIKGGSLDNAVVIDNFRVLNEGGLRYRDECVRHKMLDLIGDISILGMPVIGHIKASKTGHRMNHMLAKKLKETPSAWKVVEVKETKRETPGFAVPEFPLFNPSPT